MGLAEHPVDDPVQHSPFGQRDACPPESQDCAQTGGASVTHARGASARFALVSQCRPARLTTQPLLKPRLQTFLLLEHSRNEQPPAVAHTPLTQLHKAMCI